MGRTRHLGITLVAIFAVIAGLGEVVVGFTGSTLGILSRDLKPNAATAIVGAFYSLGGLSLLTMKKWGAVLGILFISAEILGEFISSAEALLHPGEKVWSKLSSVEQSVSA